MYCYGQARSLNSRFCKTEKLGSVSIEIRSCITAEPEQNRDFVNQGKTSATLSDVQLRWTQGKLATKLGLKVFVSQ